MEFDIVPGQLIEYQNGSGGGGGAPGAGGGTETTTTRQIFSAGACQGDGECPVGYYCDFSTTTALTEDPTNLYGSCRAIPNETTTTTTVNNTTTTQLEICPQNTSLCGPVVNIIDAAGLPARSGICCTNSQTCCSEGGQFFCVDGNVCPSPTTTQGTTSTTTQGTTTTTTSTTTEGTTSTTTLFFTPVHRRCGESTIRFGTPPEDYVQRTDTIGSCFGPPIDDTTTSSTTTIIDNTTTTTTLFQPTYRICDSSILNFGLPPSNFVESTDDIGTCFRLPIGPTTTTTQAPTTTTTQAPTTTTTRTPPPLPGSVYITPRDIDFNYEKNSFNYPLPKIFSVVNPTDQAYKIIINSHPYVLVEPNNFTLPPRTTSTTRVTLINTELNNFIIGDTNFTLTILAETIS